MSCVILYISACVSLKDIFFLVDSSVGPQNFEAAKEFVSSIIEEFSSKDSHNRFALLTYSDEVQIVFSLGRYRDLAVYQNAVKYARYRPGNTNVAGALRVVDELSAEDLGDRHDAENIVYVITDGNGNVNEEDTVLAADELKTKGARIIPIAVNMKDYTEVESIASSRSEVFKPPSYSTLDTILDGIVKTTCKNGNVIEREWDADAYTMFIFEFTWAMNIYCGFVSP